MDFFSIVIPVYNSGKSIENCLDKIRYQSFTDYEIILVNDGSKDNSLDVIENYINKYRNIKIQVINKENAGAGEARNTGIEAACGKYIVFIDADDYIEDNYLYLIHDTIEKENSDVVFVDVVRENSDGKILRKEPMSIFQNLSKDALIRWQLTGKMPWAGWRKVVKSSVIRDNKIEYAPIKVGEESIFSFRVLQLAQIISFQPNAVYHYVETGSSLTSHDTVSNSEAVFEYMYNFLTENGYAEKYARTIRAMALTTVAIGLNVISQSKFTASNYRKMKRHINKYKPFFEGDIDLDCLDNRVKACYPWIKLGMPLPVFLASKFQHLKKKLF